jgi:hypothetical protein
MVTNTVSATNVADDTFAGSVAGPPVIVAA